MDRAGFVRGQRPAGPGQMPTAWHPQAGVAAAAPNGRRGRRSRRRSRPMDPRCLPAAHLPLPGATPTKPGTATRPLPGIAVDVVHKDGTPCEANEGGYLVIKQPWPSMLRTIYGDNKRYESTYWSEFPGMYFTGDGARKDEDGYIWIMGRVDDVVNVSGHRLGTSEVESALVSFEAVAEAAVVSRPDELKGNALVAFVTLKDEYVGDMKMREELRNHVAKEIGPIAKPDEIRWAKGLPKTRSGKIMRRLLRELATSNEVKGDVTTLEDFGVLENLRSNEDD